MIDPDSGAGRETATYADAVGFIRVKEKRDLLNASRLAELLSLEPEGIIERLGPSSAGGGLRDDARLDGLLGSLLESEYRAVDRFDHEDLVVPILRFRYDVHNLKVLFRRRRYGGDYPASPVAGNHPALQLEKSLAEPWFKFWPEEIAAVLRRHLAAGISPGQDGRLDLELDLSWTELGLAFAGRSRLPLAAGYFRHLQDFAAVKFIWRGLSSGRRPAAADAAFLPTHHLDRDVLAAGDRQRVVQILQRSVYGPSLKEGLGEWLADGSWVLLERDMDNFLLDHLAGSRFIAMGPEPLFAYLLAKETDLLNVRTIFVLKKAGLPERRIKKYLRRLRA